MQKKLSKDEKEKLEKLKTAKKKALDKGTIIKK